MIQVRLSKKFQQNEDLFLHILQMNSGELLDFCQEVFNIPNH